MSSTESSSSSSSSSSSCPILYDLIVIGGGVVGLACLRAATLQGWKCVLVEAEQDLLSHASGKNSGIVCTGVDTELGSLERALIRDSISQIKIYCQDHNIPFRPCGSLICRWPWDDDDDKNDDNENTGSKGDDNDCCRRTNNNEGNNKNKKNSLDRVLDESHDAGDTHAKLLKGEELLKEYEPNLASSCRGAVHVPGEIVIDPWLYSISLAVHATENGATICTNFPVDLDLMSFQDKIWTIRRRRDRDNDVLKVDTRSSSVMITFPTLNITKRPSKNFGGLQL
jgi:glycerol-3-phosphate dehydrogenase